MRRHLGRAGQVRDGPLPDRSGLTGSTGLPAAVTADAAPAVAVRPARTADVAAIRGLLDLYAPQGILLDKATVALYEDVQEFVVAEAVDAPGRPVVGCGALHVMWQDLAEVRTIAADPAWRGRGVGHAILVELIDRARELGIRRLFCLTFEVSFFASHGFEAF